MLMLPFMSRNDSIDGGTGEYSQLARQGGNKKVPTPVAGSQGSRRARCGGWHGGAQHRELPHLKHGGDQHTTTGAG